MMEIKNEKRDCDRDRCNKILSELYNIDGLLARYDLGPDDRPSVDRLIEIGTSAGYGDFRPYERFIELAKQKADTRQKRQAVVP